jgi:hypothetical protein
MTIDVASPHLDDMSWILVRPWCSCVSAMLVQPCQRHAGAAMSAPRRCSYVSATQVQLCQRHAGAAMSVPRRCSYVSATQMQLSQRHAGAARPAPRRCSCVSATQVQLCQCHAGAAVSGAVHLPVSRVSEVGSEYEHKPHHPGIHLIGVR